MKWSINHVYTKKVKVVLGIVGNGAFMMFIKKIKVVLLIVYTSGTIVEELWWRCQCSC